MKRILALALIATLLAVVAIQQVEAFGWKTYNDPEGRFSMKYPSGWECEFEMENIDIPDAGGLGMIGGVMAFIGQNDIKCVAVVIDNPVTGMGMAGKFLDEVDRGEGTRVVMIYGRSYIGTFTFIAPSGDFDSANRKYFEPMIDSIKVK